MGNQISAHPRIVTVQRLYDMSMVDLGTEILYLVETEATVGLYEREQ